MEKAAWVYLKKYKELLLLPAILLGEQLKEIETGYWRYLHAPVYCNIILKSQDKGATQVCSCGWTDKEAVESVCAFVYACTEASVSDMVYAYMSCMHICVYITCVDTGYYSATRKNGLAICNHMDELWGHSLKWKRVGGRKRKREGKRGERKEGRKTESKQEGKGNKVPQQRRGGPCRALPEERGVGAPWESAVLRGFRNWPGLCSCRTVEGF